MRLPYDANLSPKLVGRLADLFPGSTHVFLAGLDRETPDEIIWEYARANEFAIVTADSDFLRLANEREPPPQVIQLERCDYRTAAAADLLRRHAIRIAEFAGGATLS